MSKHKGQDYDRINGSMDLQEARLKVASQAITINQLLAQITSLKNELADVLEDQAGMRAVYGDSYYGGGDV